jgi:NodT family efflux transporter outer membrane factor (OMF) lipoprotein
MMKRRVAIVVAAGMVAVASGCAIKRDRYEIPSVPVPTQFKQSAAVNASLESPPASAKASVDVAMRQETLTGEALSEWWRILSNQELDALIDRVLANNADLRIATQRIVQAVVRADQARADRWPVLSLPFQAKGEGPKDGIGTVPPGGNIDTQHTYQLSLRADWRVDLWGERASANESLRMQLLRTTYQRDDVRRQLVTSAANLYVEYLSLNDRIRVARETEGVLAGLLEGVSRRLDVGDATLIDLEQQRTAVYAVQATIPALELQRDAVTNALAVLMGVTPNSLALSDKGLDSLKFPRMLPGVPASLVLRRPDVRVIESRLLSADADIDTARTRILPPLDLTAQVGYGSFVLSQLFQSQTLFWNAIANISLTIFDYSKRSSEVNFTRALYEELVETYVRVIYNAVRETDDALATVQMTGKRIEAQQMAVNAAKRAWDFSRESYEAGAVDHLVMIDTERTYHRTLDEFHRIRMDRMRGVVALFGALGGGVPNADSGKDGFRMTKSRGTAETTGRLRPFEHYQWRESDKETGFWLVELAGMVDRHGVPHIWRDVNHRLPEAMRGRSFLLRQEGVVEFDEKERSAWYRINIARFDTEQDARAFCDSLLQELQRCRILSSLDEGLSEARFIEPEARKDSNGLTSDSSKKQVLSKLIDREKDSILNEYSQSHVPERMTPSVVSDALAVDSLSDLIFSVTLQPVSRGTVSATIVASPGGVIPREQAPVDEFEPSVLRPASELSVPSVPTR